MLSPMMGHAPIMALLSGQILGLLVSASRVPIIREESEVGSTVQRSLDPRWASNWTLTDCWSGQDFFSHWDFYNETDPTDGNVTYVDEQTAWSEGLINITSDGHAIMRVETTKVVQVGRKSIRLQGKKIYTGGLIIMDAYHMPFGCGTWPAWWSLGPDWPNNGEIDIIEGIHTTTFNKVSIHTRAGCELPTTINQSQTGVLDTLPREIPYDPYSCDALVGMGKGCAVDLKNETGTYGLGFNQHQGGTYALKWTSDNIEAYYWPRGSVPNDVLDDQPEPSNWGTPVANFHSPLCKPSDYFDNHYSVFDTTFCGSWAGLPWVWNGTVDGETPTSCRAQTGYATCGEYVLNEGQNFVDAYWEIGYVKYFNSTW